MVMPFAAVLLQQRLLRQVHRRGCFRASRAIRLRLRWPPSVQRSATARGLVFVGLLPRLVEFRKRDAFHLDPHDLAGRAGSSGRGRRGSWPPSSVGRTRRPSKALDRVRHARQPARAGRASLPHPGGGRGELREPSRLASPPGSISPPPPDP